VRGDIHLTSLEEQVKAKLDELGVEYIAQHSTRTGFVIDFALHKEHLAIEVDGPLHNTKKAKIHDRFKDYQLKREGWTVLRIPETQMNNLDSLLSSAIDDVRSS
jgi:very-short-patch-repair endonuclease